MKEGAIFAGRIGPRPALGIGFRLPIAKWTFANLHRFDILEITIDHYIWGGDRSRGVMRDLVGRIPLAAHGVGLSIGTDVPVDETYLERVAIAIEQLRIPCYSEHLAWTKVPGHDLANLLPLPKTEAVAASIIEKVQFVQAYLGVPFALENISYVFEFPDSVLSDVEFFNLIHRETGVGLLLDVENLLVNSHNHGVDASAFLEALEPGTVSDIHIAGGPVVTRPYLERPVWLDNHSDPVPEGALALMDRALRTHSPRTIVLERDDKVHQVDEIARDIERITEHLDKVYAGGSAYA